MSPAQIRFFELRELPYGALYETPAGKIMKMGVHEGMLKSVDVTKRFKRSR